MIVSTLRDKIHNEARMRWDDERNLGDPEWWELPEDEVSRRVEAVMQDETLSLVELGRPVLIGSEGVPAIKHIGGSLSAGGLGVNYSLPLSSPQKDKT